MKLHSSRPVNFKHILHMCHGRTAKVTATIFLHTTTNIYCSICRYDAAIFVNHIRRDAQNG